jgi:uncharacterized protein YbjT (DUF2867 family)
MIKNNKRTILVTGATGTVGSEVVKQLIASLSSSSRQNIIKAAIHSQNKADRFRKNDNKVETVSIDYNKQETIANALNNVDKLFLVTLPRPNIVNDATANVVKEAKKNGINHIVKLSVIGADLDAGTTIGRLHRQEEKIIQGAGIPYTFLRPNGFMQNFVNYVGQIIRNQNAFYLPAGDLKVSFVDARDVAAVAAEVLLTNGDGNRQQDGSKTYDITGPEALSYCQAAEIISKTIGRKVSYIELSEEDTRKAVKKMGMKEWDIEHMMEFYYNAMELYNLEFSDINRVGYGSQITNVVEQITGRKPISFVQFAKDYAEAFK